MSTRPAKRARLTDSKMADTPVTVAVTVTGNGTVVQNGEANGSHFVADENINDDPDRVKFAYWVPNVSGGLVISKIPQRTG